MCLVPINKEPIIANKNIVCCKVLDYNFFYAKLISPFYRSYVWEFNKIQYPMGLKDDTDGKIGEGWLHSYKNYNKLGYYAIIPKGSKYYQGVSAYASDKLIVFKNKKQMRIWQIKDLLKRILNF